MVLWEITLATAYFLGLKRTYKLALRLQRRLIGPNHPKLRQFVYRRTRAVFDVAVKVHKNIQQRDIEVGRNLGNWMLRWLDRMKPSAEIRPHHEKPASHNNEIHDNLKKISAPPREHDSSGKVNFTPINFQSRYFLSTTGMMPMRHPYGMNGQYRHVYSSAPHTSTVECRRSFPTSVFRKDIAELMSYRKTGL